MRWAKELGFRLIMFYFFFFRFLIHNFSFGISFLSGLATALT